MNRLSRQMEWLMLAAMLSSPALPAADPAAWLEKVHPRVTQQAASEGDAEFLIFLDEQAELTDVRSLATKADRGEQVYSRLTEVARRTQAPLLAWLEQHGVEHRSFWIANMILARGDLETIAAIAARLEVRRLDANPHVPLDGPLATDETEGEGEPVATAIEWGILKTLADQVWALGYDGSDIVVAGHDTGYEWDHPALIEHYRGWNGAEADHDYNWHDAIHSGGGSCGADSPVPCDDHSHGTHTMGTIAGDDGAGNQIGMAPGAKWIGCRNMNQGDGTPASYSECFEFLVAPTDVAGNNPDPSKAPHVINNSWSCPPSEGCSHDTLKTVVENTRAAGIVVVVSAGNSGSGCGSIDSPAAIYDASFTVGATDSADNIAGFSSRGLVTIDGSNRMKPDISAPGVSVRSSVPGGGYSVFSGTSMAGPHVAGAVALLLDARPDLIGKVETIEQLLRLSAVPRTSTQECGGVPGFEIPNPIYGHGRLDALSVIIDDADGDGIDNLADCAPVDGEVWTPPDAASGLRVEENNLVTALFWSAPESAGDSTRYDVLRSSSAEDFDTPTCLVTASAATTSFDAEDPSSIFYYLVRTKNDCGTNAGDASDGQPRLAGSCPETP